jgi:hypothetical protein
VSAAKRILSGEHRSGIPTTPDGRWSGNSFPLVSSELLKFITILCLLPAFADSPYFHPHSRWRSCSGASWVYSIWNGCCRLGRELTRCFQRVVLSRRRSHPNSAIWFSSFRLLLSSAAAVDCDFATAHTPHLLPTADGVGCLVCAQQLSPLSSLRASHLVLPGVAPAFQIGVGSATAEDVMRSLHQHRPQIRVPFFGDCGFRGKVNAIPG